VYIDDNAWERITRMVHWWERLPHNMPIPQPMAPRLEGWNFGFFKLLADCPSGFEVDAIQQQYSMGVGAGFNDLGTDTHRVSNWHTYTVLNGAICFCVSMFGAWLIIDVNSCSNVNLYPGQ
jgi:hypothetical protein